MSLQDRSRSRRFLWVLVFLALCSWAHACPVCGVGKEETRAAYYATTAILSFLPLIMIGGIVYYLFKRHR